MCVSILNRLFCKGRFGNRRFITSLDNLPEKLEELCCQNNKIKSLDNLPDTLERLLCENNQITHFNNLPKNLIELHCLNNPLEYDFDPTIENINYYNNEEPYVLK